MQKRVGAIIMVFVMTFGMVYGVLSGGMVAFSRRHVAYVAEDVAVKRDFGVSREWQEKYGITITSDIELVRDDDHDGLMIKDEAVYGTDPQKADTDGDGYDDGREVKNGYDPNGPGMVDTNENGIPDAWEKEHGGQLIADRDADDDHDEMSVIEEYLYGTDPQKADTDGDGYDDGREVKNGYDPVAPGDVRIGVTIAIDVIDVEVPVILSTTEDERVLQEDLERGVIRYPGMAMPGQRGNAYIAGHSSNYAWAEGSYNYVFKRLNDLKVGETVTIKLTLQNNKKIIYHYVIETSDIVAPDDERIFAQTNEKMLTLTTCWPLGSDARRLMVKAVLSDA